MGDLIIRNVALLFKWWWHFSNKEEPLWKRIMSFCNNLHMDTPIWKQVNLKMDGLWSSICNIWKVNKEVEAIVRNGLWVMTSEEETLYARKIFRLGGCI